jgi:hypothetical protein
MINDKKFKKFDKSQRSSFSYWYNHWRAFNEVARDLRIWKLKYLLHDIEKPWLKLILRDYKKVQKWHRLHNSHHLEYPGEKDWIAMIIDWECSRYTKKAAPRTAIEEANEKLHNGSMTYKDYCTFISLARQIGLTK